MRFVDAALSLASAGFAVFPLKPGTAEPAIKKWPTIATTEPEVITQWWQGSRQNRNIGIACQKHVVVLDVDTKHGKPGLETLKQLIKDGLPKTMTVRTPSGGLHLYFRHPGGHIKSVVNHWPGVDIRGNGGQVAAPGSITPVGEYRWLHRIAPVSLPPQFTLPTKVITPPMDTTASLIVTPGSAYSEFPGVIPRGERDDVLFRNACSWRERGYAIEHARVLMIELHKRCEQSAQDVYPVEDALQKLEQAWRSYKPSNQGWSQVITPQGPVVAPQAGITSLKEALTRFVFIAEGNRVADLKRTPHTAVLKLDEFKNTYANVWIGTQKMPPQWLSNKNRQTVRDIQYYPAGDTIIQENGESYYNCYSPSQQTLPAQWEPDKIRPFLRHVEYIVGDRESADRFINWCAISVQRPQSRIPWIPLIVTTPRCGKGLIFKALQKVVGAHNTSKISAGDIEDFSKGFNAWLSRTLLVCIEEIKAPRKWDLTERLKDLTTEECLIINHKHGRKGQERIFANLIAFSNHRDAVAVDQTDGRFWIVYNACERRDAEYYQAFVEWLETDGPAHLELFLKSLKTTDFKWAEPPPMTAAKRIMIDESMSILQQTLTDAIDDRDGPFRADIVDITLIEQFLQSQSQTQLTAHDRYQIRKHVRTVTYDLPQERYRVSVTSGGAGKRYRLRALRNVDIWHKATPDEIAAEYGRAWQWANGLNPQPDLKQVTGEKL